MIKKQTSTFNGRQTSSAQAHGSHHICKHCGRTRLAFDQMATNGVCHSCYNEGKR